jgi:hypothetical protein
MRLLYNMMDYMSFQPHSFIKGFLAHTLLYGANLYPVSNSRFLPLDETIQFSVFVHKKYIFRGLLDLWLFLLFQKMSERDQFFFMWKYEKYLYEFFEPPCFFRGRHAFWGSCAVTFFSSWGLSVSKDAKFHVDFQEPKFTYQNLFQNNHVNGYKREKK